MDNLILAYALILVGLLLMAAELFLPTAGVVGVVGVGGVIAGVAIAFHASRTQGWVSVVIVLIIIPLVGPMLMHYVPRTALGKKLFLSGPDEDATVAQMPVNLELEQLRGRYGKTLSALRPSGLADIGGRRVDVLTEGDMVERERWVRVIDVRAGRVIVREVDRPPDLNDMGPPQLT